MIKELKLIVAIDKNRAIGKDGVMPWHIPADLKYFKRVTLGCPVIMGRITWESLHVKPLPGRLNIVITNGNIDLPEGVFKADSAEKALELCPEGSTPFVIGGASIYRLMLPLVSTIHITHVDGSFDADTWFPDIDPLQWQVTSSEYLASTDEAPACQFVIYTRIPTHETTA